MKNTYINLTPHNVVMVNEVGDHLHTFEASGNVARVSSETVLVGIDQFVDFHKVVYGDVEGLPEQQENTYLIVSGLVKSASDRTDLVSPSGLVRNDKGQVVGCLGFAI